MYKFVYPKEGLYSYSRVNCESIISNLNKAYSKCSFSIPSDFKYKSYLNNLLNVINSYKIEMQKINDLIVSADNKYESLSNDLLTRVNNLDNCIIKYRDRMIK